MRRMRATIRATALASFRRRSQRENSAVWRTSIMKSNVAYGRQECKSASAHKCTLLLKSTDQRKLREAGFYQGTTDGEFGEPIIAAISGYFNRGR